MEQTAYVDKCHKWTGLSEHLGGRGALVKTGYSSCDKAAAVFTERRAKSKETHVADLQHPGRITAR